MPRTCGASSRSRSSTPAVCVSARRLRCAGTPPSGRRRRSLLHHLPHLDGLLRPDATRAGHRREPRRDLERPLLRLDVHDLVAGEPLLELLERTVGDDRRGHAVRPHDLREVGPGEHLGRDQLAALDEFAVQRAVVVEMRLDLLGLPVLHRRVGGTAVEVHRQQIQGHVLTPRLGVAIDLSPTGRSRLAVLDIGRRGQDNRLDQQPRVAAVSLHRCRRTPCTPDAGGRLLDGRRRT